MSETFTYYGVELPYFWHLYNLTMMNERAVEMAIATRWLDAQTESGLEVGNVTGHYDLRRHVVFDLNEPSAWYQELIGQSVVSADILNLGPTKSFPWVLSISTIEHTDDPVKAIDVLCSLVVPGGKLLVTFPTGVNDELDWIVAGDAVNPFDQFCTISRTENGWAQTVEPDVREYGPWANSVFIGEWERPA
jgi:SAM-dependent methyltransferase